MGRRAKLLKPRSWGAADICLFSIPPSVSLPPSSFLSPFHGPYSVRLPLYPPSVCVLAPAPVLLAVLFLLILLSVLLFFSLLLPVGFLSRSLFCF